MNKTEMLKKNYEFKKVLTKGKFFTKKILEIVILRNNKNVNFFVIAVSTKNGKAFQRNRAKRLIRECYKSLEPELICGNSIIILFRKNFKIENIKFKDIFDEMKDIFEDAKILKKEEEI